MKVSFGHGEICRRIVRFKTSNRLIAVALLCPVFLASEASQQPAAAENGREEQNLPQLVREPEIDVFEKTTISTKATTIRTM